MPPYPLPSHPPRPRTQYEIDEAKYLKDISHRYLNYDAVNDGGWRKVLVMFGEVLAVMLLVSFVIDKVAGMRYDADLSEVYEIFGTAVVRTVLFNLCFATASYVTAKLYLKPPSWLIAGSIVTVVSTTTIWVAISL